MAWSIPIQKISHFRSNRPKHLLLQRESIAIHSGKLGDIIYALPTCRALGVNHLILNTYLPEDQPLRRMTSKAAKELAPLLLNQNYLREVSISFCDVALETCWQNIPGIDYNLDAYRNVARHRVWEDLGREVDPIVIRSSVDHHPVHLAQMFAFSQGTTADFRSAWLEAQPTDKTKGMTVVSLTHRWRTYPNWYWSYLLKDLPNVLFIGTPSDWQLEGQPPENFIQAKDHLELASLIAGARLFLGTISFPYSIAEGLKVNRLVEVCYHNLNAFPLGKSGDVLPENVLQARDLVATKLALSPNSSYCQTTQSLKNSPALQFRQLHWQAKLKLARLKTQSAASIRRRIRQVRQIAQ